MLRELPADLVRALSDTNGFILHGGAVPSEKVSSRSPGRLCLGQALMGLLDVETWKYRLKRWDFRVVLQCYERLGIE